MTTPNAPDRDAWFEISNGVIRASGLLAVLLMPVFILMWIMGVALVVICACLAPAVWLIGAIGRAGYKLARRFQ